MGKGNGLKKVAAAQRGNGLLGNGLVISRKVGRKVLGNGLVVSVVAWLVNLV